MRVEVLFRLLQGLLLVRDQRVVMRPTSCDVKLKLESLG
jgi:hypothetical protein